MGALLEVEKATVAVATGPVAAVVAIQSSQSAHLRAIRPLSLQVVGAEAAPWTVYPVAI